MEIIMREYVGHISQLYGVEEHRLVGGKGDGMRLFEVNNGRGLMFVISADRCGDISRMYYKGNNIAYFSPCGYVAPQYYDDKGLGFLKSFTAGFMTTCGLCAVGSPGVDNGEDLPLHGTIGNTPADNVSHYVDEKGIHVIITVTDATIFGHKLMLKREYLCPLDKDEIVISDTVKNIGYEETPYMILYHINMGYPLLSENSVVTIDSKDYVARDEIAQAGLQDALKMEKPQAGYVEQCFFHNMNKGFAKIYSPQINTSLTLEYDKAEMPYFTEWKMMGKSEYVLGLEPGNCTPVGRAAMRDAGELSFLKPGEEKTQTIKVILKNE